MGPIGNYIKNAVPIPLVRNGAAKLQIYFELREGFVLKHPLSPQKSSFMGSWSWIAPHFTS